MFILQESIIDHFLFVQLSAGNANAGTPGTPRTPVTPETSGTIGNVEGGGPGGTLPDIGTEGSGTGSFNLGEVAGVGGGSINSYSQFITCCSVNGFNPNRQTTKFNSLSTFPTIQYTTDICVTDTVCHRYSVSGITNYMCSSCSGTLGGAKNTTA